MFEAIMLSMACLLLMLIYIRDINSYANHKANYETGYTDGYLDCLNQQSNLNKDASKVKVSKYFKKALLYQIEEDGLYKRGDKKKIKNCKTFFEIENEVHKILEREDNKNEE